MFPCFFGKFLPLCCFFGIAAFAQATEVGLAGLFPGKVLLTIDGGAPRIVPVGGKAGEAVRVLSVEGETATLEIDAPVVKQALAAWRKKMGLMRRRRTNSAASTGTSGEDSRPRPPLLRLAVLCAGLLLIAAVTWLVTG